MLLIFCSVNGARAKRTSQWCTHTMLKLKQFALRMAIKIIRKDFTNTFCARTSLPRYLQYVKRIKLEFLMSQSNMESCASQCYSVLNMWIYLILILSTVCLSERASERAKERKWEWEQKKANKDRESTGEKNSTSWFSNQQDNTNYSQWL